MENNSIPQSQSSLGFFGIIKESFKTTSRNSKLLVPILLLAFVSFCQLDFASKYVLGPVSKDLMSLLAKHPNMLHDFGYAYDKPTNVDYPYGQPKHVRNTYGQPTNVGYTYGQPRYVGNPYVQPATHVGYTYDQPTNGALNDVREILLVKLLIRAISSIITLIVLVATVSSSYEAYTAKLLGPKDIFLKLRKSWKRPIVTSFYMILLTLGIAFFYTISIGITSLLAVNSYLLMFLGAIILSFPVCFLYVATLWMVSLIVSVLEDGSSGLKAIGRAAELMKGKRLQASLMMVLFAVAYGFVALMAIVLASYNRSLSAELAFKIPFTNGLYCLLNLFMLVIYTIFYHEQKTSHDEKEGKSFYVPIAGDEA